MNQPKKDKKILRQAIEIGLQKDYVEAIIALSTIIDNWKEKKMDNRDTYQSLYRTLREHDKYIARRYNDITGSHYLSAACGLFADKKITETDFEGLSDEAMNVMLRYKQLSDS